jgi:hypothetical protein
VDAIRIEYVSEDVAVPMSGDPLPEVWEQAQAVPIDTYPWRTEPADLRATARLAYDDAALYALFHVVDGHIQAESRPLNGDVWRDSCVEVFVSPERVTRRHYVNIETNCAGQLLVKFGDSRSDRRAITPGQAAGFQIETFHPGPANAPLPTDDGWWLAARIPFDTLGEFIEIDVVPDYDAVWQGNLFYYRGAPNPVHAFGDRLRRRHRTSIDPRRSGNWTFDDFSIGAGPATRPPPVSSTALQSRYCRRYRWERTRNHGVAICVESV